MRIACQPVETMKQRINFIKSSFLWSYARNTWQWDVLCVLILIFIFLSPKSWFVSGKPQGPMGRQSQVRTVLVAAEVVDNDTLEQRVRVLSGQPRAKVIDKRPIVDGSGKTVGYEVDIR